MYTRIDIHIYTNAHIYPLRSGTETFNKLTKLAAYMCATQEAYSLLLQKQYTYRSIVYAICSHRIVVKMASSVKIRREQQYSMRVTQIAQ